MRARTLFATSVLLFALPVLAREQPKPLPAAHPELTPTAPCPATAGDTSIAYEVRLVKLPAGTCDQLGIKLNRDTALTPDQLAKLLTAAQGDRRASVLQSPKITARPDETARARTGDERLFVTGLEVTRVEGKIVFVPKNTPIHLGTTTTVSGRVSADGNYVAVRAAVTQSRLVGKVELAPVTTQITPVFEGGAQGQPVPFTQHLEAPDVRTAGAERGAVVPNGGTLLVGSWTEPAEANGKPLEVVAVATVQAKLGAPTPDAAALGTSCPKPCSDDVVMMYKLRNVAAADVAQALTQYAKAQRMAADVAPQPGANSVRVAAPAAVQEKLGGVLAALDKEPRMVTVTAAIVECAPEVTARAGLEPTAAQWCLTAREAAMFKELLREAAARQQCDVLSRPQLTMIDGQTGFTELSQKYPVARPDGTVESVKLGFALRVTPNLSAGDKALNLKAEVQHTALGGATQVPVTTRPAGAQFPVTTFVEVPGISTREVKAALVMANGQTIVMAVPAHGPAERTFMGFVRHLTVPQKKTLVILTPHMVEPSAKSPVEPAAGWFVK